MTGVASDITASKKLVEERSRLEVKMLQMQKLESLGVLAGGITHDFNNLLTPVIGYATLALRKLEADSPARNLVEKIEIAGLRAAELTNQMLNFSGKGRLQAGPIDLSRLVTEMIHLLRSSTSKNAVIKYELPSNLPVFQGDDAQIRQVVMNLIANASDAVAEGGGEITVRAGSTELKSPYTSAALPGDELLPGSYVYLEVSDTGIGMDEETQGRIFDPFFTTKFTGRGLGLASVLGIIKEHEGTISVESQPAQGSNFKLLFPALEESARLEPETELEPKTWQAKGTVLVIDDEELLRTVSKTMLESLGFQVLVAEGGREGIAIFRERCEEITAVLLDLTMPDLDGEATFSELRSVKKDTPVILMSGFTELSTMNRFAEPGPSGFLKKPFRPDDLTEKLGEVLKINKQGHSS